MASAGNPEMCEPIGGFVGLILSVTIEFERRM